MKSKKNNVFLILFIISFIAAFPFVIDELYGDVFAGSDISQTGEEPTDDYVPDESTPGESIPDETATTENTSFTENTSAGVPDESTSVMERPYDNEHESSSLPTDPVSQEFSTTDTESGSPSETESSSEEKKPRQLITVEPSYFDDALFIGDSRTVGIFEYGTIKGADFFCNTGMSVYNVRKAEVSIPSMGKISLTELLDSKSYGKIYIMLGINELGYNFKQTVRKYGELVDDIRAVQPDADIYIQANLHVTKKRSDSDKTFNNAAINRFNTAIAGFADNDTIFYIDVNELFDDENGNLDKAYSSDNTHPLAKYYAEWSNWLCQMVFSYSD